LQQVNHRTVRRGASRSADGSGPLPQYDLGRWDAFDPDRTLQRLAIVPDAAPTPIWLGAAALQDDEVGPTSAPDSSDMAVTVEIVPEVDLDDILEAAPTQRAPLVLPPRASAPIDLDRLLAQARAETRKSVDYFHPSTPLAPALAPAIVSDVRQPLGEGRRDPTVAVARPAAHRVSAASLVQPLAGEAQRRRLGLIVATVLGAAVATISVAAVQARVSSARSPSSVTVTTAVAAAAPRPPSFAQHSPPPPADRLRTEPPSGAERDHQPRGGRRLSPAVHRRTPRQRRLAGRQLRASSGPGRLARDAALRQRPLRARARHRELSRVPAPPAVPLLGRVGGRVRQ
jgi:hypothetical protein